MLMETPQNLLYLTGGAFLLGWIVSKLGAFFGNRVKTRKRDPRDVRIRSLEAEHRVARGTADKAEAKLKETGIYLATANETIEGQEMALQEQLQIVEQLRVDLKDSVMKTRELRTELSDRATQNVKSEVKLREVETELSVAKASEDLIATGVLDYSDIDDDDVAGPQVVKAIP